MNDVNDMTDEEKLNELQATLENNPPQDMSNQPAPPSSADRIYGAQKAGNQQRFYADLLRSFQSVLQGAAPNSGFKADPSMANSMEKNADQSLNTVKSQMAQESSDKKEKIASEEHKMKMDDFQMKMQKSKLDFQDMQANADPSSPQSKAAQDRVLQKQKELGQPVNEQSVRAMSGKDLFPMFKYLKEDLVQHYQNENSRLGREQQSKESELSRQQQSKESNLTREQQTKEKALDRDLADKKFDRDLEKEEFKSDMKEKKVVAKEDRKLRTDLDRAESTAETSLAELERVEKAFNKHSKSRIGGTGPIATLGGTTKYFNENDQIMEAEFRKIGLDEMVKMFQGMSKAVDSDAERRAFEATQPSLSNDDTVNKQIFENKKAALKSIINKTKKAKERFDKTNSFEAQSSKSKTVTQGGHTYTLNPETGKYE